MPVASTVRAVLTADLNETGTEVYVHPDVAADFSAYGLLTLSAGGGEVEVVEVTARDEGAGEFTVNRGALGTAQKYWHAQGTNVTPYAATGGGGSPFMADDGGVPNTAPSAPGTGAVAIGDGAVASGDYAHANGYAATASGKGAVALGYKVEAQGNYSFAEGFGTIVIRDNYYGYSAHAEGYGSLARGSGSHAGGGYSYAKGMYTMARGAGLPGQPSFAKHVQEIRVPITGYNSYTAGGTTNGVYVGAYAGSALSFHGRAVTTTNTGYAAHWSFSGLAHNLDGNGVTLADYTVTKEYYTGGSGGDGDTLNFTIQVFNDYIRGYSQGDSGFDTQIAGYIAGAQIIGRA